MKPYFRLAFLLIFLTSSIIQAQPGTLDSTFGSGGIAYTGFTTNAVARSVKLQSDGKILVAGYFGDYPTQDFIVSRFLPNGIIDNSFGMNGSVISNLGSTIDKAYSLLLQPNGKIVVSGWSAVGISNDFSMIRYLPNGTPDSSFGSNGIVITSISMYEDYCFTSSLQPDGKIILAGSELHNPDHDFAAVRYDSLGIPDTTFGVQGKLISPISIRDDYVQSIALQADGKIILGGQSADSNFINDFALARYYSDGSIDSTFGNNGIVRTDVNNGGLDIAFSIALQSDGKIVAAGFNREVFQDRIQVIRYQPNGSLDSTFGTNGMVTTPIGGTAIGHSVVIQPDGKIVVAGSAWQATTLQFAVVRYNTDGSLDSTFGNAGIALTLMGLGGSDAYGVALQPDKKIVVAGYSNDGFTSNIAIVRYLGDCNLNLHTQNLTINNGDSIVIGLHTYTTTGIYVDTLTTANGCDSILTTYLTVVTGMEEVNNSLRITLYPNPCRQYLRITGTHEQQQIMVVDLLGKVVMYQQTDEGETILNTIEIPPGIYVLSYKDKGHSINCKMIRY